MAKIRKRGKSYQIDYFDPTGKRVRKSFRKRKEAEAELGKRVSLIAENRYLDVKKDYRSTLKELIEKYEENFKTQASFETWKRYCLENFKAHFGEEGQGKIHVHGGIFPAGGEIPLGRPQKMRGAAFAEGIREDKLEMPPLREETDHRGHEPR